MIYNKSKNNTKRCNMYVEDKNIKKLKAIAKCEDISMACVYNDIINKFNYNKQLACFDIQQQKIINTTNNISNMACFIQKYYKIKLNDIYDVFEDVYKDMFIINVL